MNDYFVNPLQLQRAVASNKIDFFEPLRSVPSEITLTQSSPTDTLTLSGATVGFSNVGVTGTRIRRKGGGDWRRDREILDGADTLGHELFIDHFVSSHDDSESLSARLFHRSLRVCDSDPLLRQFVVCDDESTYCALAQKFQRIPRKIIQFCVDFGVRFHVVNSTLDPSLSHLDLGNGLILDGTYDSENKGCYLRRELLQREMPYNVPLLLLSHAFDHCFGGDHFASSQVNGWVEFLYSQSTKRLPGLQFLSEYGALDPRNYFAECMTAFFSPEDKLGGAEILAFIDPKMTRSLYVIFKYRLKCI